MDRFDLAQEPRADVPGPSARFDRSLAVIIGIDTYGEEISPLRSAVADAKAIAAALARDHGFESWCLFDDEALTLPRIAGRLVDIKVTPGSTVNVPTATVTIRYPASVAATL